jgi:23S rRNA (cytosine1962-C5)-methyltransferase
MSETLPTVHLKAKAHTRLSRGHLWVFSNEIDRMEGEAAPGAEVRVVDSGGKPRGTGTYNPHTLIAVRLHSRHGERLDGELVGRRMREAVERRRRLYPERQCWRAVFSEGDGLPGLIVDRLGDVAVLQILTAGMEQRRGLIVAAIEEVLQPAAIFERSDSPQRQLEGLVPRVGPVLGEAPPTLPVEDPPGISVEVPLGGGQKTGLFLDHHDNRLLLRGRVEGARVLDAFSYIGQWACCAAKWGAASVLAVESSAEALTHARANARLNGVEERCQFLEGDVFAELRGLERGRTPFDVIILDPPAFAKSRRQLRDALRGYKEINLRAMRCLAPGGWLFTASCSHHVSEEDFREMLVQAARNAGREFVLEAPLRQAKDHPVLLGHPETLYLKGALLRRVG